MKRGDGHVLAVDRSAVAVEQARTASRARIESGRLSVRQWAAEDLALEPGEAPYDFAVAFRVGLLDGLHPHNERRALEHIGGCLVDGGRLVIDGGNPLREVPLRSDR
jgi:SAM-dependent methyltransferase